MDFLFDNPLASMYGPYFLVFYIAFNIITLIVFSILKNNLDKTSALPMPPVPSNPDPYEIAYLRGGENELARSVIFALQQKDLIKISNEGKKTHFYNTNNQVDARSLKQIEQTALGWFGVTREVKEIFQSYGLSETLKPYAEMYRARLEQQQFVPDDRARGRLNSLQLKIALVIVGLGLYKLIAAIMHGYTNVIGLIIIGAIGSFLVYAFGKLPRQTKLGKAYLERLQIAFDRLKNTSQFISPNPLDMSEAVVRQLAFGAVDPLLLSVGVFGGTVLAGTMYDDYNQAFQRAQGSVMSSSSCGSSCGSSSCSSGGGDGGGSSCGGGGCGGCGGGGCGS